ncbi:MAG: RagB/SusD family nutrient uptake outer membrane protein, partial [Candidatus Symbiothrix sp.]|nr:RagB/SusD family nutrient uptake outer membrane protein [Candidatus Symbiothrix sp.]
MKKIFYYSLLFLCSSVAFLACEDNVNEDPAEEKLETTAQAEALVNAVYGPLQTLSSSYSFLVESATETTISFEEKDETKDGPQVSVFETEASNWYPIKVFNRLYTSIGAANLAIEKINNAVINENLQQASKDLLIARAKFIRGYDYFQLVQLF